MSSPSLSPASQTPGSKPVFKLSTPKKNSVVEPSGLTVVAKVEKIPVAAPEKLKGVTGPNPFNTSVRELSRSPVSFWKLTVSVTPGIADVAKIEKDCVVEMIGIGAGGSTWRMMTVGSIPSALATDVANTTTANSKNSFENFTRTPSVARRADKCNPSAITSNGQASVCCSFRTSYFFLVTSQKQYMQGISLAGQEVEIFHLISLRRAHEFSID